MTQILAERTQSAAGLIAARRAGHKTEEHLSYFWPRERVSSSDRGPNFECIFASITNSDDWRDMEWLESQADAYRSTEREKKDIEYRIKRFNRSNVAEYKGRELVQPSHESGVFGLLLGLSAIGVETL